MTAHLIPSGQTLALFLFIPFSVIIFIFPPTELAFRVTNAFTYWLLEFLAEKKIRTTAKRHADNDMLSIHPGKVIVAINSGTGTAERLDKAVVST
jgi:hypothetical protein